MGGELYNSSEELRRGGVILVKAPEFVLIPTENGVLIDGGRKPEFITGLLALSVLPVIFPLIDGTRTLNDLLALTQSVPVDHTIKLIDRLISWGVIIAKDEFESRSQEMRNTLCFLKRGETGTDLSFACRILTQKQVLILSDPNSLQIASTVCRMLGVHGFQRVEVISASELASASINTDGFLVSIWGGKTSSTAAKEVYDRLCASKWAWLRVTLDASLGIAEIGPIFRSGSGLCFSCLTRHRQNPEREPTAFNDTDRAIWAALLASELTIQLLQSFRPGARSFRRYTLPLYKSEVRTWPWATACAFCIRNGSIKRPINARASQHTISVFRKSSAADAHRFSRAHLLPFFFEEAIASRHEAGNALQSLDGSPSHALSTKLMLNSRRIRLPEADVHLPAPVLSLLVSGQAERNFRPDLKTTATLLALSVGIRPESQNLARRWAPSGGNMGSVEAYLVARDLQGLDAGVYLYQSEEHTLARINQRNVDHVAAVFAAISPADFAPAIVVFVGAYARIARKYNAFAYKLLHMDAGVASSQLFLVAAGLGLAVESVSQWRSQALAEALCLRSFEEVPTHVFRFVTHRIRFARSERIVCGDRQTARKDNPSPGTLGELAAYQLVDRMISADEVVSFRLPKRIDPTWSHRLMLWRRLIKDPKYRGESLGGALNQRSSIRRFSARSPSEFDIRTVLQTALTYSVLRGFPLEINVLVQRSSGLRPGVYVYNSQDQSLTKRYQPLSKERTGELFFQQGYDETPVIIWISGDIRKISNIDGGGYQTLLVRAGLLGHRLWMASLGLGLAGVLMAGISSDAGNQSNQWIDQNQTCLLAFLCGYPSVYDQASGVPE
jgi:SagB-type dehydrogenase family enzyme